MVRATAVAALCERRAFLFDIESGGQRPPLQDLRAVAADCLDWASFHRLLAQRFFLRRFRLFINIRMAAIIVAPKIRRSSFTAKVTVNALVIDIELSVYIFRIFICGISHFFQKLGSDGECRMIQFWRNGFLSRTIASNLDYHSIIT